MSTISSACSPVSGCETISSSMSTPELLGIDRVERMLGIDEGRAAAGLLRLGNRVQRQRRLARALRPVDFDHPAARQAADAKRDVEPERARWRRSPPPSSRGCRASLPSPCRTRDRSVRAPPRAPSAGPYPSSARGSSSASDDFELRRHVPVLPRQCKRPFPLHRRPSPALVECAYPICSGGTRGEHG